MIDVMERLRGGLIVSCQAYPGEPMRDPRTMTRIARSVVDGGAAGVRLQGLDDIRSDLDDLSFNVLREASSRGERERPAADRTLTQARRAVEKAAHLLRRMSAEP